MDDFTISMMLGASLLLGGSALAAFLWAIKDGQFDDSEKMMNAVHFDGVDELNDARDQEIKKEKLKQMSKDSNKK